MLALTLEALLKMTVNSWNRKDALLKSKLKLFSHLVVFGFGPRGNVLSK
jgi:hypothetical protein